MHHNTGFLTMPNDIIPKNANKIPPNIMGFFFFFVLVNVIMTLAIIPPAAAEEETEPTINVLLFVLASNKGDIMLSNEIAPKKLSIL